MGGVTFKRDRQHSNFFSVLLVPLEGSSRLLRAAERLPTNWERFWLCFLLPPLRLSF